MNKSKLHKGVIISEIIAIIAAIVVYACAITLIVQYLTDLANSSYASYISAWFNSLQFKSGFDTNIVLITCITSLCCFVLGLLSLIFGVKARRFVGIWYFIQMDFVGGAVGLGLSLLFPLLAITKLNAEFKYYGFLLFAFVFAVISLIFLVLQFVLFLLECKEIKNSRTSNVEVSTNEVNDLDNNDSTDISNVESSTSVTEEVPVIASEENAESNKESTPEEEKVEEKVNPKTKKEDNVTKKSSQTSKEKSKKTSTSITDENTKKVDNKVNNDKTAVKPSGKVYHISQHPSTNKWQVKLAKGEKALKLFDTQAEAINYAKEIAANQGGSIRVHSREGKIRKA